MFKSLIKCSIIFMALVASAFGQCGPNANRKPIGNGQYSCVPKTNLVTKNADGNVAIGTTVPGATATKLGAGQGNNILGVAVGDGTADDAAAIQAALNAGGTVICPPTAGGYKIGTGLTMTVANTRLIGGCTLKYTGAGVALSLGSASVMTDGFVLDGITVDVSGAGAVATAVTATRTRHLVLRRTNITTTQGGAAPNTQTGLTLTGGSGYSATTIWDNSSIRGDFGAALVITATHNAGTFMGGDVVLTALAKGTSVGVSIASTCDTNVFVNTDITGWATGASVSGSRNLLPARFEDNTVDWAVAATGYDNDFRGATNVLAYSDSGVRTILHGNSPRFQNVTTQPGAGAGEYWVNAYHDGSYRFLADGWAARFILVASGNIQLQSSTASGTKGAVITWGAGVAITPAGAITATSGSSLSGTMYTGAICAGSCNSGAVQLGTGNTFKIPSLAGTGQQYACLDANGYVVRSATPCVP